MNERIKDLAKQATTYIDPTANDGVCWDFDKEKFAQLIVRECINKIETHEIPVGGSAAGEIACEMTYSALKQIRDEIKQHFGFKE